ncbi:MAG: hypothetical protein ACI3XQ_05320 [Eubacteriales bacterium]
MFKAIHAQENKEVVIKKPRGVAEKRRFIRLNEVAKKMSTALKKPWLT